MITICSRGTSRFVIAHAMHILYLGMAVWRWERLGNGRWRRVRCSARDEKRLRQGGRARRPPGVCKRCHEEAYCCSAEERDLIGNSMGKNLAVSSAKEDTIAPDEVLMFAEHGSRYCQRHKCHISTCGRPAVLSLGDWCALHYPNKTREWFEPTHPMYRYVVAKSDASLSPLRKKKARRK